ncbi:MAG: flagellar capping protein FliD [Candidatus Azotimanducaceae bacterium]
MAAIQSLGIGSGILTNELVDDLVKAERDTIDLRLDLQKAEFEAEISAFGTITGALEKLKISADALKAPSALQAIAASTSDESALSATASSLAQAGNYSITINELAQSHSVVSKSYDEITDIVGTGELTFRFGTTTFSGSDYDAFALDNTQSSKTFVIDSSNNTLASLRSAINNADFGVEASIVNDGSGFRLLLSTEDPGISNSMEILVAADNGSGLSQFAYNSTYNGQGAVGAITEGGSTDLSAGIDFSLGNADFTFDLGLTTGIAVTVDANATTDLGGGGGTAEDNRIAIQTAIDTALIAASLSAGDVIASIDPEDGGLVLTTLATGLAETIQVTADDGVLGLNPNLGARFGSEGSLTQTQAAQSAEIEVNGLTITRESNLVTEVINGVTLNLKSADIGTPINLILESDSASIIEKVQGFVDSYNELKVLSNELTKFDLERGDSGLLLGDSTLRTLTSQIRNVMNSIVDGITGSSFRTLSEVGIATNQDNSYLLELDADKLSRSIEENPNAIVSLFATNTSASDPLIEVVNTSFSTLPGAYLVELTQVATQGNYQGDTLALLDSAITIDGDNDSFIINVNGETSETVSITQGVYASAAILAQELQLRINNDANISETSDTVTVSYNSTSQRFEFQSNDYGSNSSISFSSADTDVEDELGFGSGVGTVNAGLNVKGTINGEAATGSGQFLRASEGAEAAKPGFVSSSILNDLNVPLTVTAGEVTAGDYDFKVNVDGIASNTVSIAAGTYSTAPELAAALQTAINSDAVLTAAGKSIAVDFDLGVGNYGVISATTGAASSVNFTEISANMTSQFGFAIGGGTAGASATGDLNEAAGLRIRVLGGTLGTRGTVSYIQGTAFKLSQLFDDMLRSGGVLDVKVDSLSGLLDNVEESRVKLNTRMEALEAQLSSQFAIADGLISQLNNTEDFLSQQLSILSEAFKKG